MILLDFPADKASFVEKYVELDKVDYALVRKDEPVREIAKSSKPKQGKLRKEKSREVVSLSHKFEKQDREMKTLREQLVQGGIQLREQGVRLREQNVQLREQSVQLREQRIELKEQSMKLRDQEVELAALTAQVAHQTQTLDDLSQVIFERYGFSVSQLCISSHQSPEEEATLGPSLQSVRFNDTNSLSDNTLLTDRAPFSTLSLKRHIILGRRIWESRPWKGG